MSGNGCQPKALTVSLTLLAQPNQAGLDAVRTIFPIAGAASDARERDAAKALVALLASSAAVTVVSKTGLKPMISAEQE
jgi:hypothetical protein